MAYARPPAPKPEPQPIPGLLPSARDRELHPVRPSAAVRERYEAALDKLVEDMQQSLVFWVRTEWRAENLPVRMAQDASTGAEFRRMLRKRSRQWKRNFRVASDPLSQEFAYKSRRHVDRALKEMLRGKGIAVEFRMTREMQTVMQATIGEQVSLISSIADEHLQRVEGYVMRSIQTGRDLAQLSTDLEEGLGITKRRAAFIATDQNNKATAVLNRQRGLELGCTEGKWLHSAGGKTPRPAHVAYSGKPYNLKTGALINGEYIHPGELPRCRCVSRLIMPERIG